MRKDRIDALGATILIVFSVFLGFNQVMIKWANEGFQPWFQGALRSLIALPVIIAWAWLRGSRLSLRDGTLGPGLLVGLFFGLEFVCLYLALDLSDVARITVIFYSMPVWVAIAAHWMIPGERLNARRTLGLVIAMAGVGVAVADRSTGEVSLLGDVLAILGAILWAGIAITVRTTRLSVAAPEMQLIYQVVAAGIIMFIAALLSGEALLRDPEPIHWGLVGAQGALIVGTVFIVWFWVLSIYPASDMTAFSFLSPVFAVLFGWLVLGEQIGPGVIGGLVLVSIGIYLVSRRARPPASAAAVS